MLKALLTFVIVCCLLVAGFTWATLSFSYSDGERAGYVQKLSRKGWLCKTWEGEMAMVTLPGTLTDKFQFTADSAAVAQQINDSVGKRVALEYKPSGWLFSNET